MQNLPLSKLTFAAFEALGSLESVWLTGDFADLFAVLIVTVIEIIIARIISTNKTGSSKIKLIEIGRTGWIVGAAMMGDGEVIESGSGVGVLGRIVRLG